MGRVWRHGQSKSVYIYRFIADNSIEETILQRQSQKVSPNYFYQCEDIFTHAMPAALE